MELNIRHNYLLELVDTESKKTVGKVMKRFEIIDNKEILKNDVKELLYEAYRDFRDLLLAGGRGLEQKVFNLNGSKK
jgi:hypothetical protein